jgi:hypothetical protein
MGQAGVEMLGWSKGVWLPSGVSGKAQKVGDSILVLFDVLACKPMRAACDKAG